MENKEITVYELMGLVEKNKAPKEIKYDNHIYKYYPEAFDYLNDKISRWLFAYAFSCYSDNPLNIKVEILPEKNDEWEDIEECYPEDGMGFNISSYEYKINQLIKNQKYLKEKLESKDEK